MVAQSHISLLIKLVDSAHGIEVLQDTKVAINDANDDLLEFMTRIESMEERALWKAHAQAYARRAIPVPSTVAPNSRASASSGRCAAGGSAQQAAAGTQADLTLAAPMKVNTEHLLTVAVSVQPSCPPVTDRNPLVVGSVVEDPPSSEASMAPRAGARRGRFSSAALARASKDRIKGSLPDL